MTRSLSRFLPRFLLLAALLAGALQSLAAPRTGEPVRFEVPLITGKLLKSDSLAGRPVLLVFWASWCPPCHPEMDALQKAYARHRGKGLEIVAVSLDDDLEQIHAFLRQHRVGFPVGRRTDSHVSQFGPLLWPPRMFEIGRDGKLRDSHWGTLGEAELDAAIGRLLKTR